jgi:hypothetical protein
MVRPVIIFGAVLVTTLAVAAFAPGCADIPLPSDCDGSIPYECCQCSWPDDCPPWNPNPRPIPDWCLPLIIDAGCPPAYIYDASICDQQDGGTEGGMSGMSSFCSSGTCVPSAPQAWKHVTFALTWPELPPACPEDAPNLVFEGSPEPPAQACPTCSCDAPEGSCSLPDTWTVSSANCDNPNGGVKTNFDPPSGWDGSCSDSNAIPQGKLCGGVPCVQSLTLSVPIINEKPCTPQMEGWVDLPILKIKADGPRMPTGRACASEKPLPSCSGQGCSKTNSAFGACILHDGDEVCPDGWTGDRHVLYQHVEDERACTPCGCDPPSGGVCQVRWRVFSDSSCTTLTAENNVTTNMAPAACSDLDPSFALAGKSAEVLNYTKGTCVPTGGKSIGDLKLDGQVTVCCQSTSM